jgi:hypothetical protein
MRSALLVASLCLSSLAHAGCDSGTLRIAVADMQGSTGAEMLAILRDACTLPKKLDASLEIWSEDRVAAETDAFVKGLPCRKPEVALAVVGRDAEAHGAARAACGLEAGLPVEQELLLQAVTAQVPGLSKRERIRLTRSLREVHRDDFPALGLGGLIGSSGAGSQPSAPPSDGETASGAVAPPERSPVQHGSPIIMGALDRALIAQSLTAGHAGFETCYAEHGEGATGKEVLKFTIAADGTVREAEHKSGDHGKPALSDCMAAHLRTLRFAKPTGGGIVIASWPFLLGS